MLSEMTSDVTINGVSILESWATVAFMPSQCLLTALNSKDID